MLASVVANRSAKGRIAARIEDQLSGNRCAPFFPLFQSSLVDAIVTFGRFISVLQHTNQLAMTELGGVLHDDSGDGWVSVPIGQ